MDWIQVAWKWIHLKCKHEPVGSINGNEFLDYLSYSLLLHNSCILFPVSMLKLTMVDRGSRRGKLVTFHQYTGNDI